MQTNLGGGMPMSSSSVPMNNGSKYGGSSSTTQDAKLKHFAGLLCEFSKYNSDLKAILENSKLSTEQNRNQYSNVNPYFQPIPDEENHFLNSSNGGTEGSSNNNSSSIENSAVKVTNTNIPESKSVTMQSIYNLLTSKLPITVDTSKLPEYLQQIINKLVNNNDLNNPSNNQSGNLITSNPLANKNTPVDNQNNKQNKQLVFLNADEFQDLIYYFIINAVAKENGMTVTDNFDHSNDFNNATQEIQQQFSELSNLNNSELNANAIRNKAGSAPGSIGKTVSDFKNKVENGELQTIIEGNVENKNESSGFWSQFLFSVLKRASFLCSIYKTFACNQKLKAFDTLKSKNVAERKFMDQGKLESDRKNHLIDTVLSIPNVLLLFSLIFGFGTIVNAILGLIILATLVYKFIDQYPKQKRKSLIYKLLQSNCFDDIAKKNSSALMPEVAKIYQHGKRIKNMIEKATDFKLNNISQNMTVLSYNRNIPSQYPQNPFAMQSQYPSSQYQQHPNSQYPNPQQGQI